MKLFKRTVSILIGICILCSVFIGLFAFREHNSYKLNNSEKQKIVEILSKNNIKINSGAIPSKIKYLSEIKLKNIVFDNQGFAKKLLGPEFALSSANTYSAGDTTLTFEGNTFTLNFSKPIPNKDSYKNLINDFLSDFEFSDTLTNIHTEKGYAEVFKVFENSPIFTDYFKVYFNKNGIYKISGMWLEPSEKLSYKKQLSAFSIFTKLSKDDKLYGATITDVTMGYVFDIPEYSVDTVIAKPVIRITINNNSTYDYSI